MSPRIVVGVGVGVGVGAGRLAAGGEDGGGEETRGEDNTERRRVGYIARASVPAALYGVRCQPRHDALDDAARGAALAGTAGALSSA